MNKITWTPHYRFSAAAPVQIGAGESIGSLPRLQRVQANGVDTVQFAGSRKKPEKLLVKSNLSVPILEPRHIGENVRAVFNPGAIEDPEGGFHLLTRVTIGPEYPNPKFISLLCYAHTRDGIIIDPKSIVPVIKPTQEFPWGYEDPRITKIGRDYYIVATGYDGNLPQISLFTTRNFKQFQNHGTIGPKGVDDKDAFFHPEKVKVGGKEKFMLYHRVSSTGNIQVVFADSIEQLKSKKFWDKQMQPAVLEKNTLLKKRPGTWEEKLGGGPPPIKTKDGWLYLYHASDINGVYRMGVALLDLKNPAKVIARSPDFIMEPTEPYETKGPVAKVVFPQGNIVVEDEFNPGDPDVYIYYGAADKNIGLATVKLNQLVRYVRQFDADGNFIAGKDKK